VEELMERSFPA